MKVFIDTKVVVDLQYACALQLPCDCIVSRNLRGFKKSRIPVRTPEEFLLQLG